MPRRGLVHFELGQNNIDIAIASSPNAPSKSKIDMKRTLLLNHITAMTQHKIPMRARRFLGQFFRLERTVLPSGEFQFTCLLAVERESECHNRSAPERRDAASSTLS